MKKKIPTNNSCLVYYARLVYKQRKMEMILPHWGVYITYSHVENNIYIYRCMVIYLCIIHHDMQHALYRI